MSKVIVGRWGRNLAIRIPFEVARASGLSYGERIEIETQNSDIVIRRPTHAVGRRRDAQAAAAEIIAESRRYTLGEVSIRELLDEGRGWSERDAQRLI